MSNQWWIQRGFKIFTETLFEIDFNPGSLNTLIEQSDRDSDRAVG